MRDPADTPEPLGDADLDVAGAVYVEYIPSGARTTARDLDNGRMAQTVGFAPLKPAEFVTFRIGQKTADAGS